MTEAPSVGRTAIAAAAQDFMTDFPDRVVTMDGVSVDGARAVCRWTLTGTNTGLKASYVSTTSPPALIRALWQPAHFCSRMGRMSRAKLGPDGDCNGSARALKGVEASVAQGETELHRSAAEAGDVQVAFPMIRTRWRGRARCRL